MLSSIEVYKCHIRYYLNSLDCEQNGLLVGLLDRLFTLNWVGSQDLCPPKESLKNHQNSSLLPIPSKVRKSEPKVTKRQQNVSQIPPTGHQIRE